MEEINLKDLFKFFMRKIPIILFVTILVLSLGITYTSFLKTPLYSGDTTLILVKSENGQVATVTQSDIVLNQKLVSTYAKIIKSKRVLNQVIEELKLSYDYEELMENVSVSSGNDTEIIKISVTDQDAKQATRIANMIAEVFKSEIMEIYNLENVSIIDEAEIAKEPYNIQPIRDFVIYFGIGIVISSGIVLMIYYFDTSVKSSEMIEERLGIPVIGNIPLSGKKKDKKKKKNKKKRGHE